MEEPLQGQYADSEELREGALSPRGLVRPEGSPGVVWLYFSVPLGHHLAPNGSL